MSGGKGEEGDCETDGGSAYIKDGCWLVRAFWVVCLACLSDGRHCNGTADSLALSTGDDEC